MVVWNVHRVCRIYLANATAQWFAKRVVRRALAHALFLNGISRSPENRERRFYTKTFESDFKIFLLFKIRTRTKYLIYLIEKKENDTLFPII